MAKYTKGTELVRFDWFIKYMFRDKSDFEILEGFLSELLKEDITILQILESGSNAVKKDDKFNQVDIMVKNSKEELIIVEVQNNEEYDYLQRILYGTSKTIVENIKKGQSYNNVKKVISISVVYFAVGQGADYIYHGQTIFKGIHLNDELELSQEQVALFNQLKPQDLYPEYYLIKAGDFDEKAIKDTLDEWVYFLKTGHVYDTFKAKGLLKAKQKLEVAKLSPRKRAAYERDTRHLHSEASWAETQNKKLADAEKRGLERGLERGMERGIEKGIEKGAKEHAIGVAKKALQKGFSIQDTAEFSGLTEFEILQIQSEL